MGEVIVKKKGGRRAGVLIVCAAAVIAIAAILYFFVIKKPLSAAIVGKWSYVEDGIEAVNSSASNMLGGIDIESIKENMPDEVSVTEYMTFTDDGKFAFTVDSKSFENAMSSVIDGLVSYYTKNPSEFLEKTGLTKEALEENGVDDAAFAEMISSAFEQTKNSIQSFDEMFEVDDGGDIVMVRGSYSVEGEKVSLVPDENTVAQIDPTDCYFTASVNGSELTVKENRFSALSAPDGAVLNKVD